MDALGSAPYKTSPRCPPSPDLRANQRRAPADRSGPRPKNRTPQTAPQTPRPSLPQSLCTPAHHVFLPHAPQRLLQRPCSRCKPHRLQDRHHRRRRKGHAQRAQRHRLHHQRPPFPQGRQILFIAASLSTHPSFSGL